MHALLIVGGIALLYCCFVIAAVHLITHAQPVDDDYCPIPEPITLDSYGLPPMRKGE